MTTRGTRRKWSCAADKGVQVNDTEKGLNKSGSHVKYSLPEAKSGRGIYVIEQWEWEDWHNQ